VEIVKGEFGKVGAKCHLHYLEKGRAYILEDEMLDYEEGKKIQSHISGQGLDIILETIFDSFQDTTQISMNWKGTSKSLLARIILKLMRGKITKQAESELITFKNLVETNGVIFPNKK